MGKQGVGRFQPSGPFDVIYIRQTCGAGQPQSGKKVR
jgi:hypothetical protein